MILEDLDYIVSIVEDLVKDFGIQKELKRNIERHTKKLKGNISEACLEDILKLLEGEVISFQAKRKEKVLDRNAHKMADILRNGNVRITKTGTLIGNPESLKKVKEIEKENQEVGLGKKVV